MIPLRPQSGKQGRSVMNVQGISSSFGGLDPRKSMHTQLMQQNQTQQTQQSQAGLDQTKSSIPERNKKTSPLKVNTSVQCETRIEELDRVEDYYVSEMGNSEARMSVSI